MSKRNSAVLLADVLEAAHRVAVILVREIDDKQNFTLVATLTAAK